MTSWLLSYGLSLHTRLNGENESPLDQWAATARGGGGGGGGGGLWGWKVVDCLSNL